MGWLMNRALGPACNIDYSYKKMEQRRNSLLYWELVEPLFIFIGLWASSSIVFNNPK